MEDAATSSVASVISPCYYCAVGSFLFCDSSPGCPYSSFLDFYPSMLECWWRKEMISCLERVSGAVDCFLLSRYLGNSATEDADAVMKLLTAYNP